MSTPNDELELGQLGTECQRKQLDRKIDIHDLGLVGEAKDELNIFESQRKSSARIQTLQDELEQLIDDQEYSEFLTEIARDNPNGKYAKDDPADKDFVPPVGIDKSTREDKCVDRDEGVEKDFAEESISEGSQSSGGEDNDAETYEATEVSQEELELVQQGVPVAVPKESLKSMQERFPPFWRFKHALRNVKLDKSELDEEDPDFEVPLDKIDGDTKSYFDESTMDDSYQESDCQSGMNVSSDSSNFDANDTIDEEEIQLEKRILDEENAKDVQENIKGLIEMVEDMSFLGNDEENLENQSDNIANTKEIDMDDSQGQKEVVKETSGTNKLESMTCLEALENLNNSHYNSEEDPDYEPSEKQLESLKDIVANADDGKWLRSSKSTETTEATTKHEKEGAEAME